MQKKIILLIAVIEIFIGVITLSAIAVSLVLSTNTKTPNVLLFVLITASLSTFLGVGVLRFSKIAYKLLIYFSSVVILSKILLWADIISLNGFLVTSFPAHIKDSISVIYHSFVIAYLNRKNIEQLFH
ncbi:MAG TPA: hypothetical protein PL155_03630 [Candidatus Omnitrophota bacterium]|nr:hypothetical protein [Candidatus Omnitrophota bacterium]HPD84431.1 hypothetical protein [Candidatus Omnitrophota bacterium]HRZ03289.1 hypothetical protein [Candidatus Omnitrophota bacterium]